jgi:AbrB family looped-hinge helix DNA binding protein
MGRTTKVCPVTGILAWMRATVDEEGRLVIPKPLRDYLGFLPGEVEVVADGTGIHIEPIATDELEEAAGGRVAIGASGRPVDDEMIRALRLTDQR